MRRRWPLRILYAALGLMLSLAALTYGLTGTTPGTRLLLDALTRLGHLPLTYQRLQGNLLGGLELYGIHWKTPTADMRIAQAALRWKPSALLRGRLLIDQLSAERIRLVLATPAPSAGRPAQGSAPLRFSLPLDVELKLFLLRDILIERGKQRFRIDDIEARASLRGSALQMPQFRINAPQGEFFASGRARLQPPYASHFRLRWKGAFGQGVTLSGQGRISGDMQTLNVQQTLDTPFAATLEGRVFPKEKSVDLTLAWHHARWPLNGPATLTSPDGRIHLQGALTAYALSLQARLKGARLPAAEVNMQGSGREETFDLAALRVDTLSGRIEGTGRIGLRPQAHWDLRLRGQHLDPGQIWPGMDGNIDFTLTTSGTREDARLQLDTLKGRLRGLPLTARVEARWQNEILHLRCADVEAGGGRLTAQGTAGSQSGALSLALDFPRLSRLLPGLQGSLQGKARLAGPWRQPRIEADFQAHGLAMQDTRIASARLNIQPLGGDRLQAELTLLDLGRGSLDIRSIRTRLSGDLQRQQLSLTVAAAQGGLDLSASGTLDPATRLWQGQLSRLTLIPDKGASWRLVEPAALRLGPRTIALGQTCLRPAGQAAAGLCVQLARSGQKLTADARIRALPLGLLGPWLPAGTQIAGVVNGRAALSGPLSALDGRLDASVSQGRIDLEHRSLAFSIPTLQARLAAGALSADTQLRLPAQHARLSARVSLGAAAKKGARPLAGTVQADIPDLSALQAFVPQLHGLGGQASARFILGGSLQHPLVSGQATLSRGTATLLATGTHLKNLQLRVSLPRGQNVLLLQASAASGNGEIKITGRVADPFGKPKLQAQVSGHDFQAVDLPEVQAAIDPNLDIKADTKRIEVRGSVTVTQARIRIHRLPPHTVSVSSDAVVVGQRQTRAAGPLIDVVVKVIIGDNVHLDAMGLKADLRGNLLVRQQGSGAPSAYGSIRIVNGIYAAYGLDLGLSRGVLNFAGPVNAPGLDIVAERKAGSVTVKLSITGTLQTPHASISSDPPLPQADALSYLLTGHGLNGASRSDAALLLKAIYELNMSGGSGNGGLLNEVKRKTGLNEIGVQGGDTLQQSALVLGKYLTPKLYVKLTTGLFQPSNTLSLTYELTRHLSIEAQSGAAQALDFLYQIDFGKR